MSRAVLISIQPKWCELIASGKKTVEVRKRRPNLAPPFKVYIYQTRRTWIYDIYSLIADWQSKIIGEFVCEEIEQIHVGKLDLTPICIDPRSDYLRQRACLTNKQLYDYANGKRIYGMHLSQVKLYDKPKELSEFRLYNVRAYYDEEIKLPMPTHEISRPPQSWCYVEEV